MLVLQLVLTVVQEEVSKNSGSLVFRRQNVSIDTGGIVPATTTSSSHPRDSAVTVSTASSDADGIVVVVEQPPRPESSSAGGSMGMEEVDGEEAAPPESNFGTSLGIVSPTTITSSRPREGILMVEEPPRPESASAAGSFSMEEEGDDEAAPESNGNEMIISEVFSSFSLQQVEDAEEVPTSWIQQTPTPATTNTMQSPQQVAPPVWSPTAASTNTMQSPQQVAPPVWSPTAASTSFSNNMQPQEQRNTIMSPPQSQHTLPSPFFVPLMGTPLPPFPAAPSHNPWSSSAFTSTATRTTAMPPPQQVVPPVWSLPIATDTSTTTNTQPQQNVVPVVLQEGRPTPRFIPLTETPQFSPILAPAAIDPTQFQVPLSRIPATSQLLLSTTSIPTASPAVWSPTPAAGGAPPNNALQERLPPNTPTPRSEAAPTPDSLFHFDSLPHEEQEQPHLQHSVLSPTTNLPPNQPEAQEIMQLVLEVQTTTSVSGDLDQQEGDPPTENETPSTLLPAPTPESLFSFASDTGVQEGDPPPAVAEISNLEHEGGPPPAETEIPIRPASIDSLFSLPEDAVVPRTPPTPDSLFPTELPPQTAIFTSIPNGARSTTNPTSSEALPPLPPTRPSSRASLSSANAPLRRSKRNVTNTFSYSNKDSIAKKIILQRRIAIEVLG
jgi:hypothetical protein